ncbi:uncharacterized protein LOC131943436 [Physella acuta]|uniref:uncharacterized protein LOC131943436 n=1 Tax=Physella acuta TaxID=109671 RepID=UPI0027DB7325|nr:uncharacterized protein LOC131943436 [Physella acuta]
MGNGSGQVSDDALKRACYVLRFLLAGHSGLRYLYYKLYGRVAVIGWREKVTAIPEYSFLPDEWNDRSRGLGATETVPLSSGAEENLLCYVFHRDRYEHEDIFLHELTHGLHLLGAKYAIPGFQRDLDRFFKAANRSGRWSNTYSLQSSQEYLAEGAQIFYHVNAHSDPPDGIHGPIDTPEKFRDYDPDLYRLIALMYPCNNTYIDRCRSSPELEREQVLQMDCDLTREYQFKLPKFTPEPCEDRNGHCPDWAVRGECQVNPSYMQKECRVSCHLCDKPLEADPTPSPATTGACIDSNTHCSSWADTGECDRNLAYMKDKCRFSCGIC